MNEYQLSAPEYDEEALKLLDKLFPHLEGDFMLHDVIEEVIENEEERNHSYRLTSKIEYLMKVRYEYAEHSKGYFLKLTEKGKYVKKQGGHFAVNPAAIKVELQDTSGTVKYFEELSSVNKDRILLLLSKELPPSSYCSVNKDALCREVNLSAQSIDTILLQFKRLGLIEYDGMSSMDFSILVKADLYDFIRQGGFSIQEEIVLHELSKVLDEIKKVNSLDSGDVIEKMANMASTIASVISIVKTGLNQS